MRAAVVASGDPQLISFIEGPDSYLLMPTGGQGEFELRPLQVSHPPAFRVTVDPATGVVSITRPPRGG